jgi:ABC-type sugar transport system ATPase subunit
VACIEIRDIQKSFGTTKVIHGVSVDIADQVAVRSHGTELTCLFRERVRARPGETIHIRPEPAQVHLFDPQSGRRVNARP